MKFFIKCIPPKSTAQASSRILKRKDGSLFVGKMQSSKGRRTQQELLTLLSEFAPNEPYTGALYVAIDWTYPWRKSETKRNKLKGRIPCTTRPDVDNLQKMFLDACTRLGFWVDDANVAGITFSKWWGDNHGISVEIQKI